MGKRVTKATRTVTDTARRFTGITFHFGGVQWADPGPSEHEHVR